MSMLSNLWGFVATGDAKKEDEDTLSTSTTNDDETALRLLTQFPPYGTNVSRAEMLQEEAEAAPAMSPQRTLITRIEPWDSKEQELWDGTITPPQAPAAARPTISLLPRLGQDWVAGNTPVSQPTAFATGARSIIPALLPIVGTKAIAAAADTTTTTSTTTTIAHSLLRKSVPTSPLENRQDWMPDQLCKQCHGCEQPFTVFRRRHHCRLCGQVFCSSCSASFVQVEDSTLRSCVRCFEEWDKSQLGDKASHGTTMQLQPSASMADPDFLHSSMDQPQQQQQPSSAFRSRPKTNAEELVAGLQPTRTAPPHLNPGVTAASHLELIGRELLKSDAPLLWNDTTLQDAWTSKLMALATQACSTVDPNVKRNGDFLDIRPYCKLKVIPGGSLKECAYLSGVVFRKTVAHKHMAHVVEHPRIFLMSGGIEFTRNEHRIASLETLLEQEDKYTEILVGKIIKAQPTAVLLVGKSVSLGRHRNCC